MQTSLKEIAGTKYESVKTLEAFEKSQNALGGKRKHNKADEEAKAAKNISAVVAELIEKSKVSVNAYYTKTAAIESYMKNPVPTENDQAVVSAIFEVKEMTPEIISQFVELFKIYTVVCSATGFVPPEERKLKKQEVSQISAAIRTGDTDAQASAVMMLLAKNPELAAKLGIKPAEQPKKEDTVTA